MKNIDLNECSLDITTNILPQGCVTNCLFCPQQTLLKQYGGERQLSLESFKILLDKIPDQVNILFSGFAEPFLNKDCADMIVYADKKGHPVMVYTTGIGLTPEKLDKIKNIKFKKHQNEIINGPTERLCGRFTVHLPDKYMYAKHPITNQYIENLRYLEKVHKEITGFELMCFSEVHDSVKHIFTENYTITNIKTFANSLINEISYKPELLDVLHLYKYDIHKYTAHEMTCDLPSKLYHNIILPNGDIYLCCMDWALEHKLGNLFIQNYWDILPENEKTYNRCRTCDLARKPIK